MSSIPASIITPTKENVSPSALNIKITNNQAAPKASGIISPNTLGKKLRVKKSKLVEANPSMLGGHSPPRPYSPDHYAEPLTITATKPANLTSSNRYENMEDEVGGGDEEGMMPGEEVRRSSEGLKRSQSEPGNTFMFSSPGGHTPAGSAAGVVKNKLQKSMSNIPEISDLPPFFTSIRIAEDTAQTYMSLLLSNGYDDVLSLEDASEEELVDLGVKAGHAKRMKRASILANRSKDNVVDVLSKTDPAGVRVRGKSAGEERTDTFEADIKRAEEIRRKGRAKSAVGREMAKKELTLKYDPTASVNDMDYAKSKLHAQAAKIRELEAKLAENVMDDETGVTATLKEGLAPKAAAAVTNKKLSAEERLKAHKDRKAKEVNATAKQGQWQAPPPKEEGIKKVKQNDKLLDRLTCKNNEERRDREKAEALKKKRAKAAAAKQKKMEGTGSAPPPPIDGIESPAPGAMRSKAGKDVAAGMRKTAPNLTNGSKPKLTAQEKKDALLARLSLSTAQRRASTEGSADDKVKKALAGHKLKKKKFNMATAYDPEAASCETCGSKEDCEEDVDTPGTFYCRTCWDEYDEDAEPSNSLRRSMSELKNKPTPVNTNGAKHDQLPTSPPTKQEAAKQLKSPPPAPPVNKSIEVVTDVIPENLWIIHDNPTLPSQIQNRQLQVMIETKDGRDNWVRIIMGTIQSCGRVKDNDRGTESLMVKDLAGFYVNKIECETRVQNGDGNIIEFKLEQEGSVELTGDDAKMSVKSFLKGCTSRVDVILDPHNDGGEWFPLKESNRSMAPQFKSNGVGYLRLGDDMSKNGVAFLSEDDCESFFSEENVSPMAGAGMRRETPKGGHVTSTTSAAAAANAHQNLGEENEEDADELDFGEEEIEGNPSEIIKTLQEAAAGASGIGSAPVALKWHEKVDLITRLGKLVSMANGREFASSSLVTLQDMLKAKNVNVHVLRAIVVSIGRIGWGIKTELTKTPSWRTIILDLLKLLKSKQVAIEAKQTLKMLHGRCFGLKQVLGFLNQALGRGKSAGGKKGNAPVKGKAAGNTAVTEIVEWVADSVEDERHGHGTCISDKSTIENVAGLFMSCVENRDVKCRRAAQEGLVGVLVLGVAGGNFDRVSVLSLIDGIEKSNAKMHCSIVKLVHEELASLGVKSARAASAGRTRVQRGASAGRVRKDSGGEKVVEMVEGGVEKKAEDVEECARRWGEVQYLLRKPPMQAKDMERVVSEAKQGIYFLETLEVEASRLGMLRGALSRCVLPYDENTSTLDQANVANGPALQSDLDKVDLEETVMTRMRDGAIALRGLVRVKIADDNDLDLAATALKDVVDFFDLLKKASGGGEEGYKLLRTL
ncbi:hypothetical protein TrLO_g9581 [Triparma laevis f. longispina]|uniref:Uncharacterized protein n=1 Tax=Triparma laevis f. longispina TaxID=1714387 RepID=A0A9W6ZU50_9STRA|nr:hypothetical protein TrLO_g9581 [Triparma laevis f. longispina]